MNPEFPNNIKSFYLQLGKIENDCESKNKVTYNEKGLLD